MRAIGPFMTVKREPVSLTPISKSKPRGSPRSTWSFTGKSNTLGVPDVRTTTLPCSSAPTGTDSWGRFGTASSIVSISAWMASRRVAEESSSAFSPETSAMAASASACWPLPLNMPICLLTVLRLACISSVRIWRVLRSASSAVKAATSRNACGFFRVCRRATTESRSFRNRVISNMVFSYF